MSKAFFVDVIEDRSFRAKAKANEQGVPGLKPRPMSKAFFVDIIEDRSSRAKAKANEQGIFRRHPRGS